METWTETCGLPLLFNFEPHPNGSNTHPANTAPRQQLRKPAQRGDTRPKKSGATLDQGENLARIPRKTSWPTSHQALAQKIGQGHDVLTTYSGSPNPYGSDAISANRKNCD